MAKVEGACRGVESSNLVLQWRYADGEGKRELRSIKKRAKVMVNESGYKEYRVWPSQQIMLC